MPDRWACESVIMGIMVQEKAFQVRPYGVIAFTPSTPAMAVATVTITFRMVFRVSLLIFMMFVFLVLSVRSRPCSRGAGLPELQFRTCALSGRLAGRLLRPGRGTERWLIKKIRVCFVFVCAAGLQLAGHVEAGTLLGPLGRLHRAVAVEVGAEVAVAADTGVAELLQQLADEQAQGRTLFGRTGILGTAFGIQSAFVADAHGVAVAASHVCAGLLQRAGG